MIHAITLIAKISYDLFFMYNFPMLYKVFQWRYIFLILGEFLDQVLVEMGYALKAKGQNSKKQCADQSEYTDEY